MIVEKHPLSLAEDTDIDRLIGLDTHTAQRFSIRYRGDDQPTGIFKTDEPPVEQMVNGWSEQEAVLAFRRSSLLESRHALQWLDIKSTGSFTRAMRQNRSIFIMR